MTKSEAKQKFLNWWKNQIGYAEGANNWTKYAESADLQRLYGWKPQNQPWCDLVYDAGMIECFGLEDASKLTYQPIGQGSAACKFSAAFYSAHNALVKSPEAGDQIFFYDANGEINHTGVVEAIGGGIVYTIEGNKSDRVLRGAYAVGASNIAGYGRPHWEVLEDGTASADVKPGIPPQAAPDVWITYCAPSIKLPEIVYGANDKDGYKGYVELMQKRLETKGYSCGWCGADGEYGELTKNALVKFQKARKLDADGICGSKTWAALLGVK